MPGEDSDDEAIWQDECFRFIRVVTAVIAEYGLLAKQANALANWILTDLRETNRDLLQAIEGFFFFGLVVNFWFFFWLLNESISHR